ncbi:MAG: type II secretion system F family protein [Actinomycetota bacterium]|nr:type II secretion system F family protein [Actinomycetota bacterium]
MKALIELAGAAGVLLFASGVPVTRRPRLAQRVSPYLSGLGGKPSSLLVHGAAHEPRIGRWLEERLRSGRSERNLGALLDAAGVNKTPSAFRVDQLTSGIGGMVLVWLLAAVGAATTIRLDPLVLPPLSAIGFATGFLGREWLLGRTVASRRAALAEELPIAIDLVTLAIMAGESVPAAFERAGRVMESSLGAELRRVVAEIRAGAPTVQALEALTERVHVTGIGRFVDALCTGIEKGAPLADVLRAQADDGREAHRRLLLELGGRREVLMLVPVVFLIMPVVVVFALFPGLVSLNLLVP